MLSTKRTILRKWELSDASNLYKYASDDRVGPITGWPPHESVKESEEIIKTVLSDEQQYAICLKESPELPIGSIGIMNPRYPFMESMDREIGYWLGVPYWGKGLMPEVVREILRYSFEELSVQNMWCGYYEGNEKSKRVQDKIGFIYELTRESIYVPLMKEKRNEYITKLTKKQWEEKVKE